MYCELHGPMGHGYAKCPLCDAADASPEVDRAVASAKEKLRLNPDLQDSIHTRIDRALLAEHARANELQASLDLRWKADMRAIELWRAAGQGRELTLPGHTDLCVWLLEQGQTSIAWKFGYAQAKEEADMDKRFCPHCNPCNHDGNGKCRAPEMTAPPRESETDDLVQRLRVRSINVWDAPFALRDEAADTIERQASEIESLRAECGLRQIQGYNEGKEAASARLYEAEAEQLTRDMRQRAERAESALAARDAALTLIMRNADAAKEPCGTDPESAAAIRNGKLASLAQIAAQVLGLVRGPDLIDAARAKVERKE